MALGVILTPYGHTPGFPPAAITRSSGGATSWAEPHDPQYYTRGEAGFFYDTPLGAPPRAKRRGKLATLLGLGAPMPNDFDLVRRYGYLPVKTGWVVTEQGYQSGGWRPRFGHYPGQPQALWPPVTPLSGLGQALPPVSQTPSPASAEDLIAMMAAHNDRVFALTLVSTSAVAISAIIGLFRTLRLIKSGA
jgi:hypothetical protein